MHAIAGIREVAVVGVPDALLGQAIQAYVVLEPEVSLSCGQIRAQCITRLENFMVPQRITLCADLPRTTTGKVSKKALLEQTSV
jgi:long-chain acyl-CoA synthetase